MRKRGECLGRPFKSLVFKNGVHDPLDFLEFLLVSRRGFRSHNQLREKESKTKEIFSVDDADGLLYNEDEKFFLLSFRDSLGRV